MDYIDIDDIIRIDKSFWCSQMETTRIAIARWLVKANTQSIGKDRPMLLRAAFAAGVLAFALPWAAFAAATDKDVQVAGSVLGFTTRPLMGTVRVGIIYAPDSAASTSEQQELLRLLGVGLKVDDVTLVPLAVPLDKAEGASVDMFFVTGDLGDEAARLAATVRSRKMLCLTTDLTLVRTGVCTIGVQSAPVVKITVSKEAGQATGVSFAPAFKMMISEI